jgi:hypothetical protein
MIYGFTELDELVLAYATTIHKSRGDPADDAALPDAAAELGLHRRDARQASRGSGWAAQSAGDRSQGRPNAAAVVEAAGMAVVLKQRARV